jgi:hypothetical protein
VVDVETEERRIVGPEEVAAYRVAVQAFLRRTRAALAQAGATHVLLRVPTERAAAARGGAGRDPGAVDPGAERAALAALRRARVLVPR